MGFGGVALKSVQTLLYALEFCCAAIILGLYSYFMAVMADRDVTIPKWTQAVEGMSGAAVLYTIFGVILTCCLGGKKIFALLGIVLDLLFCGAFVAIAVLTRDGATSCSGNVRTPIGNGNENAKQGWDNGSNDDQYTYAVSLGTACTMNKACFAVAIVGALLFLISAIMQVLLARHHKKEKAFGPSPRNNYTSGSGKTRFWQRRRGARRDPEMAGAVPPTTGSHLTPGHAADPYRPSHDTAMTGSTAVRNSGAYDAPHKPLVGGYHTAPTGTYNQTARY